MPQMGYYGAPVPPFFSSPGYGMSPAAHSCARQQNHQQNHGREPQGYAGGQYGFDPHGFSQYDYCPRDLNHYGYGPSQPVAQGESPRRRHGRNVSPQAKEEPRE